jgi:hypothetical protein
MEEVNMFHYKKDCALQARIRANRAPSSEA